MKQKTFVIFSQVYVPDPASVGQHLHDVAAEMVRRGHRVIAYVSGRGYEDPSIKYPRREVRDGVEIHRIPLASFGKTSIPRRVAGTASFMWQVLLRGLFSPRPDALLVSTSPPMIGFIGQLVTFLRSMRGRIPLVYWAMDLNPDQLVAMGRLSETDVATRFLHRVNRSILGRSDLIIALDRFMAARLRPRTTQLDSRLLVIPPWPHESHLFPVPHSDNTFRREHGLSGKFVVMYSGNHSPANPLDTLLEAAKHLASDDRFRFLFVGGGVQKPEVEKFIRNNQLTNAISLPYQPIETLRFSLSAADVHVVSLGSDMVGIIHPCKVYGSMAVARPVLFFGPKPSHVSDLLDEHGFGRHVDHSDVEGAVSALKDLVAMTESERHHMGDIARKALTESLSQERLCGLFCDRIEALM